VRGVVVRSAWPRRLIVAVLSYAIAGYTIYSIHHASQKHLASNFTTGWVLVGALVIIGTRFLYAGFVRIDERRLVIAAVAWTRRVPRDLVTSVDIEERRLSNFVARPVACDVPVVKLTDNKEIVLRDFKTPLQPDGVSIELLHSVEQIRQALNVGSSG
jgi:hypothetical protein